MKTSYIIGGGAALLLLYLVLKNKMAAAPVNPYAAPLNPSAPAYSGNAVAQDVVAGGALFTDLASVFKPSPSPAVPASVATDPNTYNYSTTTGDFGID